MSEENQNSSAFKTSSKVLQILIDGYIRYLKEEFKIKTIIPTVINELLACYSEKQIYIQILNAKELALTFYDISSNNMIKLNKQNNEFDVGGTREVCICYKENINVDNLYECKSLQKNGKYNAIFKAGGDSDEYRFGSQICGILLYPNQDVTTSTLNNNLYYYELPLLPFNKFRRHHPVYSEKYGLILLGGQIKESIGKIINLKIDTGKEMKWNIETLPNEISLKYSFPANYCLINAGDEELLFIVNGSDGLSKPHKQTSIYNLQTKECQLLLQDHPFANYLSTITYSKHRNRIFIAGGGGGTSLMHYYDLYKQKYDWTIKHLNNAYQEPTMWLNHNHTILNVAAIDKYKNNIFYEWVDLRSYENKWVTKKYQFTKQTWHDDQLRNLFLVPSYLSPWIPNNTANSIQNYINCGLSKLISYCPNFIQEKLKKIVSYHKMSPFYG